MWDFQIKIWARFGGPIRSIGPRSKYVGFPEAELAWVGGLSTSVQQKHNAGTRITGHTTHILKIRPEVFARPRLRALSAFSSLVGIIFPLRL